MFYSRVRLSANEISARRKMLFIFFFSSVFLCQAIVDIIAHLGVTALS